MSKISQPMERVLDHMEDRHWEAIETLKDWVAELEAFINAAMDCKSADEAGDFLANNEPG